MTNMLERKFTMIYVSVSTLIPYAKNPRKNDHAVKKGCEFIKRFGFSVPVIARSDHTIIDGHLRLKCAKKLGMTEVPVIIRDDLVDEAEIRIFRLSINRFSELADWDIDLLREELEDLKGMECDIEMLEFELDDTEEDKKEKDESDNEYTKKIKAPIYEPKGEKPDINELVDTEKTKELLKQIEQANISDEIKTFLIKAAYRHNVFSYEKIAEYYCHAPKEVQELMENSALVIIDFKKAIENGFVKLASDLAEAYLNDEQ